MNRENDRKMDKKTKAAVVVGMAAGLALVFMIESAPDGVHSPISSLPGAQEYNLKPVSDPEKLPPVDVSESLPAVPQDLAEEVVQEDARTSQSFVPTKEVSTASTVKQDSTKEDIPLAAQTRMPTYPDSAVKNPATKPGINLPEKTAAMPARSTDTSATKFTVVAGTQQNVNPKNVNPQNVNPQNKNPDVIRVEAVASAIPIHAENAENASDHLRFEKISFFEEKDRKVEFLLAWDKKAKINVEKIKAVKGWDDYFQLSKMGVKTIQTQRFDVQQIGKGTYETRTSLEQYSENGGCEISQMFDPETGRLAYSINYRAEYPIEQTFDKSGGLKYQTFYTDELLAAHRNGPDNQPGELWFDGKGRLTAVKSYNESGRLDKTFTLQEIGQLNKKNGYSDGTPASVDPRSLLNVSVN